MTSTRSSEAAAKAVEVSLGVSDSGLRSWVGKAWECYRGCCGVGAESIEWGSKLCVLEWWGSQAWDWAVLLLFSMDLSLFRSKVCACFTYMCGVGGVWVCHMALIGPPICFEHDLQA